MTRLRRVAAILVVAVLLAAVPGAAHAEKTIGLSSGTFAFTVDAGGTGQGEVVVSCDGDEPIKVLVYVADVVIDAKGEQAFVTPQREGASLMSTPASWFRIYMPEDSKSIGNTPYVELDPGEELPIRFDFSPPRGTAPGDHNTIILFEMFEFTDSEGSSAQVSGRLGTRVALRVTGQTTEKMSIRPIELPTWRIGGEIPFRFVVNNEGNVNERVYAAVSVLDRSEEPVAQSVVATDSAVYSSASQEYRGAVTAPGTAFGPYTVEVTVSYLADGQQLAGEVVSQRTVWLIPLWAVVLAGFIVAYALLYLLYRTYRRKKERKKKAAASRKNHHQRELEIEERRRRREMRAQEAERDSREGLPADQAD